MGYNKSMFPGINSSKQGFSDCSLMISVLETIFYSVIQVYIIQFLIVGDILAMFAITRNG